MTVEKQLSNRRPTSFKKKKRATKKTRKVAISVGPLLYPPLTPPGYPLGYNTLDFEEGLEFQRSQFEEEYQERQEELYPGTSDSEAAGEDL